MNKSDKSDAVRLAQLARTGWYGAVHIKSEASDQLRLLLVVRERLIRIRMDIEGQVRGLLKAYGIRLGPVNAGLNGAFHRLVEEPLHPDCREDDLVQNNLCGAVSCGGRGHRDLLFAWSKRDLNACGVGSAQGIAVLAQMW